MDGLSAAATIIALLEVTAKLIGVCWKYKGLKGAARAAKRLLDQLKGLETLLMRVDELLDGIEPQSASAHAALVEWTTSERLKAFNDALERLMLKLEPSQGWRAARDVLIFPLQEQEVEDMLREIERMKSALALAISVDQTVQLGAIKTGIQELRLEQLSEKHDQHEQAIIGWLAAPDVSVIQMQKQSERQSETGRWLLQLPAFEQWLLQPNTLFWLHGIPGSGKSILCSTAIHHLQGIHPNGLDKTIIFFYFDFSDDGRTGTESMIRNLITQLAHRKIEDAVLNQTWELCQQGKRAATEKELLDILFSLLGSFIDVTIVIDAIDEARKPEAAMGILTQIHDRKFDHVHIMLASRWSQAIENDLKHRGSTVELDINLTGSDISDYVHARIDLIRTWDRIPDVKQNLALSIIERANGMFRLAQCLVDLAQGCRTIRQLDGLLQELPAGLHDVYKRILLQIPDRERESTRRMLEWLAFCGRPMRIDELTHAIAVNQPMLQGFDYKDLDIAPFESPLLCSSLVSKARATIHDVRAVPSYYNSAIKMATEHDFEEIRLAHASVKEYLLDESLRNSTAKDFYLDSRIAHRNIAETCLLYLLMPDLDSGVGSGGVSRIDEQKQRQATWPLLFYAANFWLDHANLADFREETWTLTKDLFQTKEKPRCGNYGTWVSTMTPEISYRKVDATRPLYYAATFGATEIVQRLLKGGASVYINEVGGHFSSTPVQAATYRNRLDVVKVLLAAGADPNITDEAAGSSTLCWAITGGYAAVAEVLIEHGAIVLGGEWEWMWHYAHEDTFQRCYSLWCEKHGTEGPFG